MSDEKRYSLSSKRPRAYERKFDWEEAHRRHKAGETMKAIAADFGVCHQAVSRALKKVRETLSVSAAELARRRRDTVCERCGGRKNKPSVICLTCRRSGWYGRGLEAEWDLFEPTTIEDLEVPSGYLQYLPKGRYELLTTWGYPEGLGSGAVLMCQFLIWDTAECRVVESFYRNREAAERGARTFRSRIDTMNREEKRWESAGNAA